LKRLTIGQSVIICENIICENLPAEAAGEGRSVVKKELTTDLTAYLRYVNRQQVAQISHRLTQGRLLRRSARRNSSQ
jgi:hypothetical protein